MLSHYLKIAIRIFTRNKLVSIINVFGLSVALTGCLLISIFIHDELRYDRFHEHADRIYRVTRDYITPEGSVHMHLGHLAPPFGPLLKNDFPDVIESARIAGDFNALVSPLEKGKPDHYQEIENAFFVEPSALKIFSIKILSGNSQTSLDRPLTLMISDETAQKYFGTTDVVGKEVKFFEKVAEITGTFKAFPPQSHWHPNALVSFKTLEDDTFFGTEKLKNGWENNAFLTYILVNDDFDAGKTAQLFPAFIDRHMPTGDRKQSASTRLFLQPLTSIHLHSHLDSEAETNGDINHVYAMGAIGVFLIVIACFNFINLSTARATQRGKEVGLRKVSGAERRQLIFQYIGESTLTTLLAMVIAVAAVPVCLVWLNAFTDKSIVLYDYTSPVHILILLGFVLVIGALAGLYPAFVISGFKPAQILKGQTGSTLKGGGIRRVLVVAQFGISTILIIATLIIYQQLDFLNNKELGYKKEQIITFPYPTEADDRYEAFYNTITQHPAIVEATRSNRIPTWRLLETNYVTRPDLSAEKKVIMKNVGVDRHFFVTYNIPMVNGKNFQKETRAGQSFEEGVSNGFILNESACKLLGWLPGEAVGKEIINGGVNGTIVGVVKDFHFESLHEPIAPIVFMTYVPPQMVSVLVSASAMKEGIAHIANAWKQLGRPDLFKYEFVDDRYSRLYDSETHQQELFIAFAAIAIFIASLGLFGLATFNAVQRSKEVSIRKTLGASVQSILQLLSKEIVVLILIANVLAWPIAWYFMKEWLNKFAYHIDMSMLTYVGAGAFTLFVTLITISTQTIRAALTNPATMLRNE